MQRPGKKAKAPKVKMKPEGVTVSDKISMMGSADPMGNMHLIVVSLGDDGKLYSWNGPMEAWVLQG